MPQLTPDEAAQRYHLRLLIDAGHVTADQLRTGGQPCTLALTLTGQELLNKLRRGNSAKAHVWIERLLTVSMTRLFLGDG